MTMKTVQVVFSVLMLLAAMSASLAQAATSAITRTESKVAKCEYDRSSSHVSLSFTVETKLKSM